MTLNGLVIKDRIIRRFISNCQACYQAGGGRPVHQARGVFFADLRRDYNVNSEIVPQLRAINAQLEAWEVEAQEQPEAA